QKIVKLIGPDALPDTERLYLDIARLIKVGFLQQSAYDPVDTYSTPEKQIALLRLILDFKSKAEELVRQGVPLFKIREMQSFSDIMRAKLTVPNEDLSGLERLRQAMEQEFAQIETEYL
ncbi:MAG: V-type ATP synthase subunit A, partial [Brevinematales bacterium]